MVVNALINRIEVSGDYKVKIDFNFDFEQFTNSLSIATKKDEQSVCALCPAFYRLSISFAVYMHLTSLERLCFCPF